jgi:hypothetical protein
MIGVMEPMTLNANEPSDPQVENLPTLMSTIHALILRTSEALSESSKLDDIITMMHKGFKNMGNLVNSKLEKALAPINSHL